MTRNLLIIGQSHVAAFRSAAKLRRDRDPAAPRTRTIHLGEERFAVDPAGDAGAPRLGDVFVSELADQVARHQPLVASCIGGNVHNALALLRHPRAFDFLLSGDGSSSIAAGCEPIPESLVRAALAAGMAPDLASLRRLAALQPGLVHLESPPPLASDALIADLADAFFREKGITPAGVAPPELRRKMWQLQSRLFEEACVALGVPYLAAPAAAMDKDGFLRPDFAADATHGNARYGEAWIRILEAR